MPPVVAGGGGGALPDRDTVEGSFSVAQHRRHPHRPPQSSPRPQWRSKSKSAADDDAFEESPMKGASAASSAASGAPGDGPKVHGGGVGGWAMTTLARVALGRSRRRIAVGLCLLAALVACALRSRPGAGGPLSSSSASSPKSLRSFEEEGRNENEGDDEGGEGSPPPPGAYGRLRPLLGASVFSGTPACRVRARSSAGGSGGEAPKGPSGRTDSGVDDGGTSRGPCVAYHPAVDLSLHVPVDEASTKARAIAQQGGGGLFNDRFADDGDAEEARPPPPQSGSGAKAAIERPGPVLGVAVPLPSSGSDSGSAPAFALGIAAVLTRRGFGFGHEVNQDRASVVAPYLPLGEGGGTSSSAVGSDGSDSGSEGDFLIGVFDGHGTEGHATAHFAAGRMPGAVSEALRVEVGGEGAAGKPSREQVKRALSAAFLEVDRTVPDLRTSGCTASVAVRLGDALYVANAGDSLTFVAASDADGSNARIVYRSRPDKPHLPEERARIEGMGGQVYLPPPWMADIDSSRVIAPVDGPGAAGGMVDSYGLAMSRSFGDREVKAVGVVADPVVDALDLRELRRKGAAAPGGDGGAAGRAKKSDAGAELFVVSVTDGLFDRVTPEDIAARLAQSLYGGEKGAKSSHPLKMCEELIFDASMMWLDAVQMEAYRDDITVAVSKII